MLEVAARKTNDAPAGKESPLSTLVIPFALVHLAAIATPIITGFHWKYAFLALGLYYARMAAITIGYHRYFAHRSFKTGRVFQFLLAFFSQTSVQKGALWWAAHHRDHHKYSDTEDDVHSPIRGLWWSHVGWILSSEFTEYDPERIKDLQKYPELRWLNRFHLVPPALMAAALLVFGGLPAFLWGFIVSTVLLWHGTFLVNSLNHIWGTRRYATTDTSKNNPLIALLTMGEGWHNNHHHFMTSARQGFFWWEIDGSFYLIKLFEAVGLVWDVKAPPKKVLEGTIRAAQKLQPPAKAPIAIGGFAQAD